MDIDTISSFIDDGSITEPTREHLDRLGVREDETRRAADPRRWVLPRQGHGDGLVWIGPRSEPVAAIRYCRVLPRMTDTHPDVLTWYHIGDHAMADTRRDAESAVRRLCSVLEVLWVAGTIDRLTADSDLFRSILSWSYDSDIGDLVYDGSEQTAGSILHQYTADPAAE